MKEKGIIITGALLLALGVGFGAFGAHLVEDLLTPARFDVYQTGVQYHFYHALGLLLIGALAQHLQDSMWLRWSGRLIVSGIVIFSGSLYLLTLTDTGWLGAITPIGGAAFIGGWMCLMIAVVQSKGESAE
jgi:uncharacterized membrane protein YgdD (TMEM256/DUF423 family)